MKKIKAFLYISACIFLLYGCGDIDATSTDNSAKDEPAEISELTPDNTISVSENTPAETDTVETVDNADLSGFGDPLCILAVLPEKIELRENATNISGEFADIDLSEEMRDKLQHLTVRLEKEGTEALEFENCLYEMIFYWNGMAVEYLYFSEDKILLNFTADDSYSRYELYSWTDNKEFLGYMSELIK